MVVGHHDGPCDPEFFHVANGAFHALFQFLQSPLSPFQISSMQCCNVFFLRSSPYFITSSVFISLSVYPIAGASLSKLLPCTFLVGSATGGHGFSGFAPLPKVPLVFLGCPFHRPNRSGPGCFPRPTEQGEAATHFTLFACPFVLVPVRAGFRAMLVVGVGVFMDAPPQRVVGVVDAEGVVFKAHQTVEQVPAHLALLAVVLTVNINPYQLSF